MSTHVEDLVEIGLRDNPLRAHLLVSTVLGKHIPVSPHVIRASVHDLAARVRRATGDVAPRDLVVVGFAETATGLTERLADVLDAGRVIVTTRYRTGRVPVHCLREEHSHAPEHWLLAPVASSSARTVVIVDDEVTTGRTIAAMVALVRERAPKARIVVACLIDALSDDDRARLATVIGHSDAVVALGRVAAETVDVAVRRVRAGSAARAQVPVGLPPCERHRPSFPVVEVPLPPQTSATSRFGWSPQDRDAMRTCARRIAELVLPDLPSYCTVLGTEELLWLPQLVAEELEKRGRTVRAGSTTRSPARVVDDPAYPLRSARQWVVEGWSTPRYVYNPIDTHSRAVVVVVDDALGADADEYIRALADAFREDPVSLIVVRLQRPDAASGVVSALRGPAFSTYDPDDVGWLVSDVSGWGLERPIEEREPDIQAGKAHYSESLPEEYRPSTAYLEAYTHALQRNAARVASGVLGLAKSIATRADPPVLVSLARAGVPVGVLLRDALQRSGIDAPHYALSVIRDRGIDEAALDAVVAAHGDRGIRFIDGWTGKGTIAGEMARSIRAYNATRGTRVRAGLWVLTDPLGIAEVAATNEDFLVPSACLNATVTGLISRTVRTPRTRREGGYDGAAFYRELAAADRTREFLAEVRAQMSDAPTVPSTWRPSEEGSASDIVAALQERFDVGDASRLKPGLGETTRVLLRRPARAIYVRWDAGEDVAHVRRLAGDRGVPIHEIDEGPFRAVGVVDGFGE